MTTVSRYSTSGWMEDLPELNDGSWTHGCGYFYNDDMQRVTISHSNEKRIIFPPIKQGHLNHENEQKILISRKLLIIIRFFWSLVAMWMVLLVFPPLKLWLKEAKLGIINNLFLVDEEVLEEYRCQTLLS